MRGEDFEQRYRHDRDPWNYETSVYEKAKYAATLDAAGPGPFRSALELGGSIGVFSALLAPRCARLITIDLSQTAVNEARGRLRHAAHVTVLRGAVPAAFPDGRFDLIVASEILYYLAPADLAVTIDAIGRTLLPGGRLVAVHWRPPGPDRWHTADEVHARLGSMPWLRHDATGEETEYLLDAWIRDE